MREETQSIGGRILFWLRKLLVLEAIIALEVVLRVTHSPAPPSIYVAAGLALVTIYLTYIEGRPNGLLNAAAIVAYLAYRYSMPGHPLTFSDVDRQIIYAGWVTLPLVVLQVGYLKQRDQRRVDLLEEAEQRYYNIIEHTAEGIFRVTPNGKLVLANRAFARITGFATAAEIMAEVNGGNSRFVEEKRREEFFSRMAEERQLAEFEALWQRGDGSHIWVSLNAHQVLNADGSLRYYEGSVTDITERKLAELELRREKNFSEALVESNANGILAFDRDLTITAWNPAMERITGLKKAEVIGRRGSEVQPDLKKSGGLEHMKLALQGKSTYTDEHYFRVAQTGREGYSRSHYTPIHGQSGEIIGGLCITQDVTARIEAEQKLRYNARYQEALNEVSLSLIRHHDLGELLADILKHANDLMDSQDGCIHMVASDHSHITVTHATGSLSGQIGRKAKPGDGLVGQAWQQGEIMTADDYDSWSGKAGDTEPGAYGAVVAVPLVSGNEVVAVIAITYSDRSRKFSPDQLSLLGQYSQMASVMIDNARLFSSLRTEARRREQSERLVRQSEERFRSLASTANDAIVSANDQGEIVYVNAAAERLLGYKRHSIVGRNFQDLLPSEYFNPDARGLERFLPSSHASLVGGQVELAFKHHDGHNIPVEVSAATWEEGSSGDRRTFYTLIIRDITERLENQERFKLLVEGVKDYAIYMLDPNGRIISWNAGAEQLKGYKAEEVIGREIPLFCTPEDIEAGLPQTLLETARTEGHAEGEVTLVRKDGSQFYASVLLTALYDPSGQLRGFSKVVRDITEHHRLDEMKSDFVSMASHQLKTPVALIRGYADNMLAGITGELNDQQRQYLRDIQEISAKNYNLISDLLSISRLERGVVSYDVRPVKIEEVVTIALRNYRQRLEGKGLSLDVELGDAADTMVQVDAFKTAEAIGNIVDNALRYTDKGGITVKAKLDHEFAQLSVADTGSGMDQETMHKLFQRDQVFSGAPQPAGTAGLGLFIAQEFILAQGGRIAVSSKPGRGTEFTFSLPLSKVKPKRAGEVTI